MNKFLGAVLAVAVLLPAGWVTASAFEDGSRGSGTTITQESTGKTTAGTTTAETTTSTAETTTQTTTTVETQARGGGAPVDISGPCDEVEHANDPRCTGAGAHTGDRGRNDDGRRDRGRGGDDRGGGDHSRGGGGDQNRSGSNSGRG